MFTLIARSVLFVAAVVLIVDMIAVWARRGSESERDHYDD